MSRQLRCPNCGGEHTLVNPGITMIVCEFCKTVVYWDADSVLCTGVQSILPEADTRLFLHASGKLLARDFDVVGHLRYDHGRGQWDEWYLQLGDGAVAWLSEDERELSLEKPLQLDSAAPPSPQLQVGQTLSLEGVPYTVREIGTASCVGGEGQLPFTIQPGERYAYADLASLDGSRFASLEYDGDGSRPHAFAGHVLSHADLHLDGEPLPATGHVGKGIRCPNCDAALGEPAGREVKTLVCEYCGAQNDLTGAEAQVMGLNPRQKPDFAFEIGQRGRFLGQSYEVCGRLLYQDNESYQTREYLLFNPGEGYLWLSEEQGHFVMNRPTQQAPAENVFGLPAKRAVRAGTTRFRAFEWGTLQLSYVDGALPWLAKTGDRFTYADLIAPPHMLSAENDGQEVEYFYGTYVSPAEVWEAFGRTDAPPRPLGVHAAQPYRRGAVAKTLMAVGGIFALINLVLLFWSADRDGQTILEQTFQASEYLGEALSQPFAVGAGRVMGLSVRAPLSNSWLAVETALLDSEEKVVEEMEGDISYYYGVEEGESWSEGNQHETFYFKAPKPGTYRLILKASGGSGLSGPCQNETLTLRVTQGAVLSRYFGAVFLLAFCFPFFAFLRRRYFEKRRWSSATGASGSDDDDDD